jgi:hypothetical protein
MIIDYLLVSGIVALVFGLIILFAPNFFKRLSSLVDRVVFVIDDLLYPFREWVGIALILIAGAGYYATVQYPTLFELRTVWVIALIFGLLYLVFPNWLAVFSRFANRFIFPTREYVMGSCKLIGAFLILAAVYIFVMIYRFR